MNSLNLSQSGVLCQARGKKRQIGWFPANYVKLLSPSTSKTTPTEPIPPKLAPSNSGKPTQNPACIPQHRSSGGGKVGTASSMAPNQNNTAWLGFICVVPPYLSELI